jgi:hypothetical protein
VSKIVPFVVALTTMLAGVFCASPALASEIVRTGNSFTQSPPACSCATTIDGYVFSGLRYYDPSADVDSAVELWWALAADPHYVPLPPVTSVSATVPVSGTVDGS